MIVFETIVSKLTYVWELLDLEHTKSPENVVLLETPLTKSSWVELQSDSGLAGRLAGRLTGCLTAWMDGWLASQLAGWLTGWMVGWLTGPLASWLAACLTGWLAGWWAGWRPLEI